jgi:hypothetical protein
LGIVQLNYEIVKEFSQSKDNINFKIIDYGSDEYKKSVALGFVAQFISSSIAA